MKRATWFVLFLLVGVSCLDQPDCFRQNLNLIGVSFKKLHDNKVDTVALLHVSANGYDGEFYKEVLASSVSLPLNYLRDTTEFLFKISEAGYSGPVTTERILRLSHKSKVQFVSEECGQRFVITDMADVINNNIANDFDSVRITSKTPSNPAPNNITIYRCPHTNVVRLSFRQLYMDTVSRGRIDLREIETVTTPHTTLYGKATVNTVVLPLNTNATSSTYNFNFTNGDNRTVTFGYESTSKEILKSCGLQNVYSKLTTTNNTFEFVKVLNDSIYDPPITNVETYRCPTTNQIRVSFRTLQGSSEISKEILIKSLTADYLGTPLYSNLTATSVVLPLNPNTSTTSTTFTIDIDGIGVKTLTVNYAVTGRAFHVRCGEQPVYSAMTTPAGDATFQPTVLINNVQFPVVDNIEILL